ncbi:MAG: hypothetical protein J6A59_03595 [Lachnospiraceae bacterium]|nr:hypothetical protein [Lachnospiraceae bacterium]
MGILIKSFFRQRLSLMKSVAWFFVGMIVAVLIVWPYVNSFMAYIARFSDYYELIISLGLLLLLFRKNPMICMDEATLHYLEGTKTLRLIYVTKYLISVILYSISAAVITYILTSSFDLKLFIASAVLMNLCNVLNWKSYHEVIPMHVSVIWYVLVANTFVMSQSGICILVGLVSLVVLSFIKNEVNLEKYKKLMRFSSKTMVAQATHNHIMIVNLANEMDKDKDFRLKLKDGMLKYPLVAKSIVIDTLRRPNIYWGIKIILLMVAIICANEITTEGLSVAIIPVMFGNLIASFIRDSAYEANKLVLKQDNGLAIPYSDWCIAISYSIAPLVLCLITLAIASVFCVFSFITCLSVLVVNLFIVVMWHKMVVSWPNRRKLIEIIGYSLCMVSFMIII